MRSLNKTLIVIGLTLWFGGMVCAQTQPDAVSGATQAAATQATADNNEYGIVLSVLLDDAEEIPTDAARYLSNKLAQTITANGVGAFEGFSRFFITARLGLATRDIVPGPPAQIAENMEITLYIADYFDQKIFATTTINAKGVGTNESKAFINAVKNLNPHAEPVAAFVRKGKDKIIDYYRAQCDNIIKQAQSLAVQKKYDEALYLLTSIPDAAGDCYDKALDATAAIFQQYTDYLCEVNLALAKAAWAAEQNSTGAQKAGVYMSLIYPDAACYGDAQALYTEIKGKVLDDWKFEMKKWQDGVNLESQRIEAARAIGVAYGRGQQPTSYGLVFTY
ncbi:MAG: hypothetical protein K2K51_02710, partial [Bacteroidales bacterium]|nr:hypothetical protein [Bacteroidales bacterium]